MRGLTIACVAMFIASGLAWGGPTLGTEFTIWDGMGAGEGSLPNFGEDGEVEPGCIPGQQYDLEGFFFVVGDGQGGALQMVGGYDFVNGTSDGWMPGDLFIDVNGDALFGSANNDHDGGNSEVNDNFGYEFALRLSWDSDTDAYTFTAWALDPLDTTLTVFYGQNEESNPWRYHSGGTDIAIPDDEDDWTYWSGLTDAEANDFAGGSHYAAEVDLGFLYDYMDGSGWTYRDAQGQLPTGFTAHYTYQCGNDNLMGTTIDAWDPGTPIPEPASITMVGLGIAAVMVVRMRKKAA